MHFSLYAATAVVALAASACAQTPGFASIYKPDTTDQVRVGSTFDIKWQCPPEHAARNVKLVLIGGPTQGTQQEMATVTPSIPCSAGQFAWSVPKIKPQTFHGLKIIDVNDANVMQYSQPFHIVAGTSPAPSTSYQGVNKAAGPSSPAAPPTPAAAAPPAAVRLDCASKNATVAAPKPKPAAAGSNGTAAAPADPRLSKGAHNLPNNSTSPSMVLTGSASFVHAGLLSVFGGVVALAFAL